MAYCITVDKQKQYIELVHTGQIDAAQALAGCREAMALSQSENIHLILIDICAITSHAPTASETYQVDSKLPDIFSKSCRIAVVFDPATWPEENVAFSENVCLNRGLLSRGFTSRAAAEQWLLTEPCLTYAGRMKFRSRM